jgi:hypothetical protein
MSTNRIRLTALTLVFFVLGGTTILSAQDPLIGSIVKAPIVPDGNVAGAHTDIVINLNISPDPSVPGRTFSAGDKIRVTFPSDFLRNPDEANQLPVEDIFSSPTCAPGNLECTTGILIQGWPQHPILPSFPPTPLGEGTPQYHMSMDGNVLQYAIVRDITPAGPLPGPGVKQIHAILNDFSNPSAGTYDIGVEFLTSDDTVFDQGVGQVVIHDSISPSINVTSVLSGVPGNPNTIYQSTNPGEQVPLPYDFYLWDGDGNPLTGVQIVEEADAFVLRKDGIMVGNVSIESPSGGDDASIFTEQAFNDPIPAFGSGVPTGRLQAFFQAGSAPGDYEVAFSLTEGNSVTMFTNVIPEPSALFLAVLCLTTVAGWRRRPA